MKDATAHASPTGSNTHVLPVHLVHTPYPIPDTQNVTDEKNGPSDPLTP